MPPVPPVALPPGRSLPLPRRGMTFVRELPGPPGAPALVLLHGWLATSDLNWFSTYEAVGRSYRVVAMDLRGHGRGIRSVDPFRLADCAADVLAVVDALGLGQAILVGYSMGGPVAQLAWRAAPRSVGGLVLCATAASFPTGRSVRALIRALALVVTVSPPPLRRRLLAAALARGISPGDHRDWLVEEVGRHRLPDLLEAGRELQRFDAATWVAGIDVPTAVLIPTRDDLVPPRAQRAMAALIPGATVFEVPGDHLAVVDQTEAFVPRLLEACADVARRMGRRAA